MIARVWALKYITVFPRGKTNAAVKWSSMRFVSSIKTDVSYTCWPCTSALCLVMLQQTKRKKSWPSVARIEPLRIRFFHGSTYHLFPTKAGPALFTRFCQLPWLHRQIDHVLQVEHCTLQGKSVACHYVSPREGYRSIQLDLGIIVQCFI